MSLFSKNVQGFAYVHHFRSINPKCCTAFRNNQFHLFNIIRKNSKKNKLILYTNLLKSHKKLTTSQNKYNVIFMFACSFSHQGIFFYIHRRNEAEFNQIMTHNQ